MREGREREGWVVCRWTDVKRIGTRDSAHYDSRKLCHGTVSMESLRGEWAENGASAGLNQLYRAHHQNNANRKEEQKKARLCATKEICSVTQAGFIYMSVFTEVCLSTGAQNKQLQTLNPPSGHF